MQHEHEDVSVEDLNLKLDFVARWSWDLLFYVHDGVDGLEDVKDCVEDGVDVEREGVLVVL